MEDEGLLKTIQQKQSRRTCTLPTECGPSRSTINHNLGLENKFYQILRYDLNNDQIQQMLENIRYAHIWHIIIIGNETLIGFYNPDKNKCLQIRTGSRTSFQTRAVEQVLGESLRRY